MPVEQITRTPERGPAQYAYVLTHPGGKGQGSLTALFVDHGTDARWPQVSFVDSHWKEFLKGETSKRSNKITVIHEGPRYKITGMTFDDIIRKHSEPGHLLYLVGKENNPDIKILQGEKEDFEIGSVLTFIKDNRKDLKIEDISDNNLAGAYFGARLYPQYCEANEDKTFKEYIEHNPSFQKAMQLLGVTYDDFVETFEKLYPDIPHNNFVKDDSLYAFICKQTLRSHFQGVPEEERTAVQKVTQACDDSRNTYLPDLVVDEINSGRDVFMSFGRPHWLPVRTQLNERGLRVKTLMSFLQPTDEETASFQQ